MLDGIPAIAIRLAIAFSGVSAVRRDAPIPRLAAALLVHADIGDRHPAIDGLAHVE